MPGIIPMEGGSKVEKEEGGGLAANQDITPSRKIATITDFFKKPLKSQPVIENKSTLLGYFNKLSSPPCNGGLKSKESVSQSAGGMVTAAPLDKPDKESTMTKNEDVDSSELKVDKQTGKTRSKKLAKAVNGNQKNPSISGTIVSEKDAQQASALVNDISDGDDGSHLTVHGKKTKRKKDCITKKIEKNDLPFDDDKSKICQKSSAEELTEVTKTASKEDVCEISYQDFLSMNCDDVDSKEKSSLVLNENDSVIDAGDCDMDSENEKAMEEDGFNSSRSLYMEISYQEFLKDNSVESASGSPIESKEQKPPSNAGEEETKNESPCGDEENIMDRGTSEKKPQLGIGRFFKKTGEGSQSFEKKTIHKQLTITADVHSSVSLSSIKKEKKKKTKPSETSECSEKSDGSSPRSGKRRSNVIAEENDLDLEIIQLGTYDIALDKKARNIPVDENKATRDQKDVACMPNDSSKNILQGESHDSSESQVKQISESAKAFLSSKSTAPVSQKSTQATIMFTAKGFQMGVVKPTKEETAENDVKKNCTENNDSQDKVKRNSKETSSTKKGKKSKSATPQEEEEVLLMTPLKTNESTKNEKSIYVNSEDSNATPLKRRETGKRKHDVQISATVRMGSSQKKKKIGDDIVVATPPKIVKKMHNMTGNKSVDVMTTHDIGMSVDEDSHDSTPRKTPLRQTKSSLKPDSTKKKALKSVFKAKMNKKKDGGLKMTITRVRGKNTDLEEDAVFTPKSSKNANIKAKISIQQKNKAQELLQKAKTKSTKIKSKQKSKGGKSAHNEEKVCGVRRSSRHSAQLANQALLQESEGKKSTKRSKSKDGKEEEITVIKVKDKCSKPKQGDTPKKKTPKKVKLASIFQPRRDAKEKKPEEKPRKKLTKEEEAALQARRQFLLSSVPEPLKKQSSLGASTVAADYPPFPKDNHVQQKIYTASEVQHFWNLSTPQLPVKFRPPNCEFNRVDETKPLTTGMFSEIIDLGYKKVDQNFVGHRELGEDVVKVILSEIAAANQGFPVKRVYKSYLSRRHIPEPDAETDKEKKQANGGAKSKKRKQPDTEDAVEVESNNRKKRKKDTTGSSPSLHKEGRSSRRRSSRLQTSTSDPEETEALRYERDSSKENDCIVLGDSPEKPKVPAKMDNEVVNEKELMWTEKYLPANAADVIGNTSVVARLKTWLMDWKHRMDRDARKLQKLMQKEAKLKKKADLKNKEIKEGSQDWWTDDESDFAVSDTAESDYEEENYCNTMLIQGPQGVGKTATVHALARELGYKVFEVNASARRSGKHIISQLQEATQSHQVCKKNLEKNNDPFTMATGDSASTTKITSKPEKKLPTTFANFFSKASGAQNKEKHLDASGSGQGKNEKKANSVLLGRKDGAKEKTSKRTEKQEPRVVHNSPRKCKKSDQKQGKDGIPMVQSQTGSSQEGGTKRGLNLSKASLILFEEVDVAFEEDKGFWAAIQTIMDTTKIPILLTTSDVNFSDKFEGKYEQLVFKTPSLKNTASYLQVMCLAENLRTDYSDIYSLVELYHGDIRQTILALQFWLTSGGGLKQEESSFSIKKLVSKGHDQICLDNSKLETDDDFDVTFSRKRKLKKVPIIEEDSSSSLPCMPIQKLPPEVVTDNSSTQFPEDTQDTTELNITNVNLPLIHLNCLDSVMGINEFNFSGQNLISFMKEAGNIYSKESILHIFEHLGIDIIQANIAPLLPLPKTEWSAPSYDVQLLMPNEVEMDKKRKRMLDDVFDCEGSDFSTLSTDSTSTSKESHESRGPVGEKSDKEALVQSDSTERNPRVDVLLNQSIQAFSDYYDNCSYMDSYMVLHRGASADRLDCHPYPGLEFQGLLDKMPSCCDEFKEQSKCTLEDLVVSSKLASFQNLSRGLSQVMAGVKSLNAADQELALSTVQIPAELPVRPNTIKLKEVTNAQLSCTLGKKKATENIMSSLPTYLLSQKTAVAKDYVPMLRTVCKMEQFRKSAKAKRRFFHYLDSIGLQLKQSTIDTLCSSF
ncbi:ATPase family AAA domain-containing protein 5 isoform X2 [Lingula anatina]|uniref:ATPase family AAA domain-containing protein 5 isoform X2 n=1 Tax=Lingula anatina TaxID=7574 RepID=A0A1S3JMN7_LINAN|nr:ATPase family AAA domain-containing protein 5 isoform X2 [Lingula anatina]|eukprot:XP_013411401.1 ATPase family AAA domain-containing protein 5 isoform X2 [Lingula anatina]